MKDKKACILYSLLTFVIWQLCVSLSKIFGNSFHFGEFFSILPVINKGAAFGIFNDNPYILGTLGIFVIIGTAFYVYKKLDSKNRILILLFASFTAGVLGNTTERFFNGYVNDFIKINLFSFPVFNIFDILITGSIFLYIIFCIKEEFIKRKKN